MTEWCPAEAAWWSAAEVSRIRASYGDLVMVKAVDSRDALLTVSDPSGCGWTGTARLVETRIDAAAVEFTVFFSATPPLKEGPRVHLCGVDIRDDGARVSMSMDTRWRQLRTGDAPTLWGGVDRLVRGDFRPSRLHPRARRTVTPYGT